METAVMKHRAFRYLRTAALLAAILALTAPGRAAETDIAPAPLGTAPSASVLPNLMFTLDDSGSMGFTWMPDNLRDSKSCKGYLFDSDESGRVLTSCLVFPDSGNSSWNWSNDTTPSEQDSTRNTPTQPWPAGPPQYAAQSNTIYYNPLITYSPGKDATGNDLPSMDSATTSGWTKVPINPYVSSNTGDLTSEWPDPVFCKNAFDNPTSSSNCRRNGFKDGSSYLSGGPVWYASGPFRYSNAQNKTDGTYGWPNATGSSSNFRWIRIRFGTPHYYNIVPREYCTDANLTSCALRTSPSNPYVFPAPVRYCQNESMANADGQQSGNSGGTPRCQAKRDSNHQWMRYGNFSRIDIVPSVGTFAGRPNRTDCAAAPNCTYSEEMTNFANWFAYYHTRMQTMKTAAGRVFSVLDDGYRIGFVTINAKDGSRYLKLDKFTPTHRQDWYDTFYKQQPSGGTPLREALSRVGRHYAGVTGGINDFMPDDPIQYSCQQNYTILTTDGYWNNNAGQDINGNAIGDQDNVDAGFSKRTAGAFDGNLGGTAGSSAGSADTLADVAMYYYKTDLRTSGLVAEDNVPTTTKDTAPHQHMVTFTLGLGLDGLMDYRPDYETAPTGDFARIKNGDPSGCSWTSGKCNWPQAKRDDASALDDLWHAAVNGRGKYFSAKDPGTLQTGLTEALAAIQVTTGAAAASATSTPNITPTDNYIFSSTYRTGKWDGEVVAERIDTVTGDIIPGLSWSAGGQLNARVSTNSDTRKIYTFAHAAANKRIDFLYNSMNSTYQAVFKNKCSALPQCAAMAPADQARANDGENLVNWLRGQSGNSDIFRARENVLGDTVNSKPAFVAEPRLQYADAVTPDYNSFKIANANRQGVLYISANDGMLHAFNGDTGQELWAWVPRMIRPDLYKLAVSNYNTQHRYFVDGSPQVMDVFFKGPKKWKTVLVGGLKAGGRGFFALDITDPLNPAGLWEVCADPSGTLECADAGDKDDNIGFSFGDPIITKWAKDPDKWVAIVSSGYNNVSPGDGKGYVWVIDIETGKILDKKDTGVGDTTTPSGLAHLTGFTKNFAVDNTASLVYGGDLEGNVWRLDMTSMSFQRIGRLRDGSSPAKPQSVTTKVDITQFDAGFNAIYVATGRLLGTSDLQDPATLVPPQNLAYQQTVYGFKDTGSDLGNLRLPAAKLVQQTISVVDANTRTISNNAVDWSTQNGWYVDLNPANQSPGERVTIDPQLVRGVLLVATNEPKSEPCSAGGVSWTYQFDYRSGSYIASAAQQAVGTKLSQALVAGVVVYRLPSGQLKYSAIDVTGKKVVGGVNPGVGGSIGKRVSWRELIL
jgi:type IV pilus assembly protein PilY1